MKPVDLVKELTDLMKIILVLIYMKKGEKIKGKIWLYKELYVIADNIKTINVKEIFEPHLLGQYNEEAEVAIEQIGMLGLLKPLEQGFKLSKEGEKLAKLATEDFSKKTLEIIEEVKAFLNDLTKEELLGIIYHDYPEMAINSIEREKIEKNKIKIAMQLFLKEKISLGKAVEIAGIDRAELIAKLRKRKPTVEIYST